MILRETLPKEYLNGGGAGRGRNSLSYSYFPLLFYEPVGFLKCRKMGYSPSFRFPDTNFEMKVNALILHLPSCCTKRIS